MPSKPTEALLDVNVLIAAVFADHVAHAAARGFVESLEKFATRPTTQGGFLRFATRPWKNAQKEEQPPRLTMAEAMEKLRELTAAEGHVFPLVPKLHLGTQMPAKLGFANLERLAEWRPGGRS